MAKLVSNKRKKVATLIALTTILATSTLIAGNMQVASALFSPPTRSGWEKHNTSPWEVGAKATITRPTPTIVIPGTDWWWARSFVFHGVYALDSTYGAVGAGPAKYIPLGQTGAVYKELKYEWDSAGARQGYIFGLTTPTSAVTYQVYYDTLGEGCWLRYTSTQGWDSDFCIPNWFQGHPSFQATTNTKSSDSSKNTIVGIYTTVKYKSGSSWYDLSANPGGKYCRELGTDTTYGKIQYVTTSGANQLKTGNSASTNSCSGIRDGAVYPLPG
jgi:hypothetical protein